MTSSSLDHQHTLDRKPEQSQYMRASGTSSNITPEPGNRTWESSDSTSTSLTEKAFHQTTNPHPSLQTKNQQHPDQSQRTLVTKNQHSATHQLLSKNLHHQQHQSPATHTTEEDPESYRSQTNIALASLLLARNNSRPQQIWQLRLLQLQQQRLLSDLTPH
jgi:hypothetical protein